MRRHQLTAVLILLALSGPSVLAHPVPFSYLDVRLQPGAIDGALVVHILDVAHDLAIDPVNMEKMKIFADNANRGMAKRTFTDRMTIGKGADQIDLYYFGPGHTDGDAFVVFPALGTMHAGDIFANKGLPLIDAGNGGSVLHIASTLQKAHAGIKGVETIINGHMPTQTTWADLKMFADFNQDFLTWAQAQLKAGKTPEAAAPEWVAPRKYVEAGYSVAAPTMFGGMVGRLQRLQEEMTKK